MKNNLLYFLLILVLFSSCSKKSYTSLYDKNVKLIDNESTYYLSKNLLKLEIIYTINEPRVQKNGIDEALTTRKTIVTIEDPIQLTPLLVADTSQTFFTTGKQLSEDSYVNSGTNAKNFLIGETQSIFSVKEATSKTLSTGILTDSNIQADAYRSVLEIKNNITKIKTADQANFTLSLVYAYKNQSTIANEAYKPYIKKSKVKYTVIIDPSSLYIKEGNWSEIKNNTISHTIFPKHIFKEIGVLNDDVTLQFIKPEIDPIIKSTVQKPLEGIIYRNSASVNLEIAINNHPLITDTLGLAQWGTIKRISVKDLQKDTRNSILLFKVEDTTPITDSNIITLEHTIEDLKLETPESVVISQNRIKQEYELKLKNINSLIAQLQELGESYK